MRGRLGPSQAGRAAAPGHRDEMACERCRPAAGGRLAARPPSRPLGGGLAARAFRALALCALVACGPAATRAPAEALQARAAARGAAANPLLGLPPPATADRESFEAKVQLLGVPLGSMKSTACPATQSAPALQRTEVTTSQLVALLKRSGGQAVTRLPDADRSRHHSRYHFEGRVDRDYEVHYAPGRYSYTYDRAGGNRIRGRRRVPEGGYPHDLHSALAALRAWRAGAGERAHFYTVMGRRLWRVDVQLVGSEMLRQGRGSRPALRLTGEATALFRTKSGRPKNKRFDLWLSDDRRRVPLRLTADADLGEVTLDLTSWQQAPGPCFEPGIARKRVMAAR